ncbi:MAG: thymidine phosphorylase [Pseudomonadota bacterium]
MDARAIIYGLRQGERPSADQIRWFANGLASGAVTDAQAGAFAMAVCLNGLGEAGRVAMTEAMRDTGDVLAWDLPGPVADKHSTGGVGDVVSLLLAPILAEAGLYVPMISGRGLGHTGGTLDKLEAIPGFQVDLSEEAFRKVVGEVGCAIVSASGDLAPADKRLYAIRDVTGTVESIDLITASILSKKLAAGLDALVLDVKAGSGAFMASEEDAVALARALVKTANDAGCRTSALITDMDQPLASSVGNAVEVDAVLTALRGEGEQRLCDVTVALCGEVLNLASVAASAAEGEGTARAILSDGRAAERFARMVAAQGGGDALGTAALEPAPVQRAVLARSDGVVSAINGRLLGQTVVELGGGRMRDGDQVDPRVGLSGVPKIGRRVETGEPLAMVHAADAAAADRAMAQVAAAIKIVDASAESPALIRKRIGP